MFQAIFRAPFKRLAAFAKCGRGNVAIIFGLSLVPLTLAAGTGLDLARAMTARSQISEALDAAALAVGNSSGLTNTQMQALAQKYFNANYKPDSNYGSPDAVQVTVSGQSVTVTNHLAMPTTLLKAIGKTTLDISDSSTVVWGQQKLWVSLVLDNTGSMNETDNTGTSKIDALVTATHQLLTMLQNASTVVGDVKVGIVPFTVDVKAGTANVNAAWIDWTMWEQKPANYADTNTNTTFDYYGPLGKNNTCPWTVNNNGFRCQLTSSNGSSTIGSGTTVALGLFCPTMDDGSVNDGWTDRYYNGCFNSVKVSSGCLSNCQYTHTWIPNNHNTWTGCIADRTQPYDAQNTSYTTSGAGWPAENATNTRCINTTMTQGLSTNWTSLNALVDTMSAGGSTNQPVGLAWGWQLLNQGDPFAPGTLPPYTQRIIILLSDGMNTRDRWYGDGGSTSTQVDDRMTALCTNAKADGVTIYTVLVMAGNSSVLQACASSSDKYYALTNTGQISTAFAQIGAAITNLRVSH